jgi:hypothetical protein
MAGTITLRGVSDELADRLRSLYRQYNALVFVDGIVKEKALENTKLAEETERRLIKVRAEITSTWSDAMAANAFDIDERQRELLISTCFYQSFADSVLYHSDRGSSGLSAGGRDRSGDSSEAY